MFAVAMPSQKGYFVKNNKQTNSGKRPGGGQTWSSRDEAVAERTCAYILNQKWSELCNPSGVAVAPAALWRWRRQRIDRTVAGERGRRTHIRVLRMRERAAQVVGSYGRLVSNDSVLVVGGVAAAGFAADSVRARIKSPRNHCA